jgi:hypothetical protein
VKIVGEKNNNIVEFKIKLFMTFTHKTLINGISLATIALFWLKMVKNIRKILLWLWMRVLNELD